MQKTAATFDGSRVFLARKMQKISLRELASRTGLSYSTLNRVEKNRVVPSTESIERISRVLGLRFLHDSDKDHAFLEETYPSLYNFITYGDYQQARSLYETLKEMEDYYVNSPVFIKYYLLMGTTIVHTRVDSSREDHFQWICEVLLPYMTPLEQELTKVNRVICDIWSRKMDGVWVETETLLKEITDEQLRARIHYIRGLLMTNDYRYFNRALESYDKAKSVFDAHMNYDRSNRTQAMQQTVYLYLHRFEMFNKLLAQTQHYALNHASTNLYHLTKVNEARYFIIQKDYDAALTVLNEFFMNEGPYYFFKVFAYYQLGRNMEALETLSAYNKQKDTLVSVVETAGFNALEYILTHKDGRLQLKYLQNFCDQAHEQYDYLMIEISTGLLTEALVKQRKYKEAHVYAQKLLHVLYAMIH